MAKHMFSRRLMLGNILKATDIFYFFTLLLGALDADISMTSSSITIRSGTNMMLKQKHMEQRISKLSLCRVIETKISMMNLSKECHGWRFNMELTDLNSHLRLESRRFQDQDLF